MFINIRFISNIKMTLELIKNHTVRDGYKQLLDKTYSMKQNLIARVETPILKDGTNIWEDTWLDSKDTILSGSKKDGHNVFKIEHAFDLNTIINTPSSVISINEEIYKKSQGKEFVIVPKANIKKAKADYAINSKDYKDIQEQLNKKKCKAIELKEAGGFKINEWLTPEEAGTHDGWLELAVGKNNASKADYSKASKFLKKKYIPKAIANNCFSDGKGKGFFIRINENYKWRPFYVDASFNRSVAYSRSFSSSGRLLRVRAEGVAPEKQHNIINISAILEETGYSNDFAPNQIKKLSNILENNKYVIVKK